MTGRRITIVASEVLGRTGVGGAGTADSLLAVALGRHGHDVELLVASGREIAELDPEWAGVYASAGVEVRRVERLRHASPQYLCPSLEVLHALRARPPELAIVNDWRGLGFLALRARQVGRDLTETAFVVHCHGTARILSEFARKVPDTIARFGEEVAERASIELADAVVSPSAWLLDWMRAHSWPVPQSASVIPYVRQSAALDETPKRAPTGVPVRRVAFFGQLREGKGIRIFLAALDALEPELLDGVELLFLGRETRRWTARHVEAALGAETKARLAGIRLEPALTREAALAELRQPGTLAVTPSLLDNSPNTVSECIEHGIPFVAAATGGIPELVAAADRERVLCEPNAAALTGALARALASRAGFEPARPAHEPAESLRAWLDLVAAVKPTPPQADAPATRVGIVASGAASAQRARQLAERTALAVDVADAPSDTTADWIVFLDDEDEPDDGLLDALVAAQAASGADVVTVAVRPSGQPDAVRLFLGDPGALGLVENQYGVVGLVRRSLDAHARDDAAVDPEWVLLARLALAGARIVSIPEALAAHAGRPGRVGDVPGDGLTVLGAFEEQGIGVYDLPQLAATLAASFHRLEAESATADGAKQSLVDRGLDVLRAEGFAGLARRARVRLR